MSLPALLRKVLVLGRVVTILVGFLFVAETGSRVRKFGLAGFNPWEVGTIKLTLMSEFALEPPTRDEDTMGSWGLMPNTRGWNKGEPFEVNNLGLRGEDATRKKSGGVLRVAVIGGSITMAAGIPLKDTWPVHLEELLNQPAGVEPVWELLNLGVPNASTTFGQQLKRACYFRPDMILWQVGKQANLQTINRNLRIASEFARKRSIPIFAFELAGGRCTAMTSRFFELLPPLEVLYGPSDYIYPSDKHPRGAIHRRYAKGLQDRIMERRERILELTKGDQPVRGNSYRPLRPEPWVDPEHRAWHLYSWDVVSAGLNATWDRLMNIGEQGPSS
ncbi:MAG TPA: hypothetical protein EYQ74_03650 [Planctomycetes bacterium]|nr:hypothetical protein [Planctomycetota bacterium]HIK59617.1 hypothetical protein [Planctomycetota bacterium]